MSAVNPRQWNINIIIGLTSREIHDNHLDLRTIRLGRRCLQCGRFCIMGERTKGKCTVANSTTMPTNKWMHSYSKVFQKLGISSPSTIYIDARDQGVRQINLHGNPCKPAFWQQLGGLIKFDQASSSLNNQLQRLSIPQCQRQIRQAEPNNRKWQRNRGRSKRRDPWSDG